MTTYHQMGHNSVNLIGDDNLSQFAGVILSPVNYSKSEMQLQVSTMPEDFDVVFDPQLYFPRTERKVLREWDYFPKDVDTADIGSIGWWNRLVTDLISSCSVLRPSAICSPAIVPKVFDDNYYGLIVDVGRNLAQGLVATGIRPIQTAIVSLNDLSASERSMEIASILSRSNVDAVYLILISDVEPRREYSDPELIIGAMRIISVLASSGMKVTVGFCSSDMVLWKHAGASACATGKFFNLRRFTSSRFEEPSQGGGQLPYWFEESLMGFLRESDLVRVNRAGLVGPEALVNPFSAQILEQLESKPGKAWIALGWRQFMYAFADLEQRISDNTTSVTELLSQAEFAWRRLEDSNILMEEQRNDGTWLRAWRRAIAEYRS